MKAEQAMSADHFERDVAVPAQREKGGERKSEQHRKSCREVPQSNDGGIHRLDIFHGLRLAK